MQVDLSIIVDNFAFQFLKKHKKAHAILYYCVGFLYLTSLLVHFIQITLL